MAADEENKQGNNDLAEAELSENELDNVTGGGGTAKDSLSDMSTQDMLQLQAAMEKKGQLEQMISNTMKATSDTSSGIAANLKGS